LIKNVLVSLHETVFAATEEMCTLTGYHPPLHLTFIFHLASALHLPSCSCLIPCLYLASCLCFSSCLGLFAWNLSHGTGFGPLSDKRFNTVVHIGPGLGNFYCGICDEHCTTAKCGISSSFEGSRQKQSTGSWQVRAIVVTHLNSITDDCSTTESRVIPRTTITATRRSLVKP